MKSAWIISIFIPNAVVKYNFKCFFFLRREGPPKAKVLRANKSHNPALSTGGVLWTEQCLPPNLYVPLTPNVTI